MASTLHSVNVFPKVILRILSLINNYLFTTIYTTNLSHFTEKDGFRQKICKSGKAYKIITQSMTASDSFQRIVIKDEC